MEFLFAGTGLRLKWGDTSLTMNDIDSRGKFKVDMRVINDKMIQGSIDEGDVSVAEAAKENPDVPKYSSDRCKLMSESKVVIENFLVDSHYIDTVYSIQFCGLEMMVSATTLSRNGLYIGDQIHHIPLNNSLDFLSEYFDTIKHLLSFRDDCIRISNVRNNIVSLSKKEKRS